MSSKLKKSSGNCICSKVLNYELLTKYNLYNLLWTNYWPAIGIFLLKRLTRDRWNCSKIDFSSFSSSFGILFSSSRSLLYFSIQKDYFPHFLFTNSSCLKNINFYYENYLLYLLVQRIQKFSFFCFQFVLLCVSC